MFVPRVTNSALQRVRSPLDDPLDLVIAVVVEAKRGGRNPIGGRAGLGGGRCRGL
jgi:hypothetical protein